MGHRGRGLSCQTRHFHPIPEAHWYPERIGGIEQQAWNTIGHLVPCDMLSRFPHEPGLQSRRREQTDLQKNWQKFAIKSAYNIFEEGCWNNSQYEWDLVWKCKSQHKILYFSQLVLTNRLLINDLLEEQVI